MSDNTVITQVKEAMVGMPPVASGKLSYTDTVNNLGERSYDPMPAMPADVINKLDELGFIGRDCLALIQRT